MIIDITLLRFLIYLSRFRRQLGPRIERWIQDGVWQLQRRAYEGEGQRDWIGLEGEIPLTAGKEMVHVWQAMSDSPRYLIVRQHAMRNAKIRQSPRAKRVRKLQEHRSDAL
jgi:hypothetical protein